MIVEICMDMVPFTFVLLVAIIAFGNCFYILCVNTVFGNNYDYANYEWDGDDWFIYRNNIIFALIYAFRTGLGDFDTDGYK